MNCEKIEELFSLYLEDDLGQEEKAAVEEHIKTCPSCQELMDSLRETVESLTDFPSLQVSESLEERLYAITVKKKRTHFIRDFFLRPSLQPVLAAATVLLTMLSFYLFHPDRSYIEKSISRQIHLGYSKIEKLYSKAESLTGRLSAYKDNLLVSLKNINPLEEAENGNKEKNNGGI